ncbi:MAG: TetR/AcrR family transcriptional regulator [Actinomycetes bacterium]|nr:TetR/AcrR family transcriptional regulator [Acidimicrobiia bacterium]
MTSRPVRRQRRGIERMAQILEAAAEVLAEQGYENTTTNAIAATAGISPGSLYQFYANKDEIVTALAERYATELERVSAEAFDFDEDASIQEVVHRVVTALVEFNLANPGFKSVFARTDMPASLEGAIVAVHDSLRRRVSAAVGRLLPGFSDAERDRVVTVAIQMVRGMMSLIVQADEPSRTALVEELEELLVSYLERRRPASS